MTKTLHTLCYVTAILRKDYLDIATVLIDNLSVYSYDWSYIYVTVMR